MSEDAAWETVIGLEVHCELATQTKLFCGCRNAFGEEPNTNICPVCLGLPGSLPVLNAQAVELAMRIGTALHCEIRPSSFARKNYFYPDQAKDYQISQYDEPINASGSLELPDGTMVGVTRAHLEEDTGKLTHVGASGRINSAHHALVDYNRSGVPLVEIVSEPDMRSATQARAYASELRGILMATGASDGRMEEGSMRIDANISVRPAGSDAFGTRCEIKNLNSLRSLGRAIEYEVARQIALIEGGGSVDQETRHWDEAAGRTDSMRSKEEANDYRYFPEPDLVPLVPDAAWQDRVAAGMGPMPADRRRELVERLGGSVTEAQTEQIRVVVDLGVDELVAANVADGESAAVALARAANEPAALELARAAKVLSDEGEARRSLPVDRFSKIVRMEVEGELSATQAKAVLSASGKSITDFSASVAAISELRSFVKATSDLSASVAAIRELSSQITAFSDLSASVTAVRELSSQFKASSNASGTVVKQLSAPIKALRDLDASAPNVDTALSELDTAIEPQREKAILDSDPVAVAKEMGFEALGADALASVVAEAIAANPDLWARYVAGEDQLAGALTGAVMKATRGKADGAQVAAELRRLRGSQMAYPPGR